ncbi:MAG: hypothetical protein U5L45_13765 [Saprospiraceae bacterium]|nr:hypothetical protein [Saprospiraceae bacterium]
MTILNFFRNYLAHSSLRPQKKGKWFIFGLCPKMNHLSFFASEASYKEKCSMILVIYFVL